MNECRAVVGLEAIMGLMAIADNPIVTDQRQIPKSLGHWNHQATGKR
ncbi:MAG: hypothetical protein ACLFM4_12645 [Phormidium sp.]